MYRTIEKRFKGVDVPRGEETRRQYREILLSDAGKKSHCKSKEKGEIMKLTMKLTLLGFAAVSALLMTSQTLAADADGKTVYVKSCAACHAALSPKLGDKAAWEPLLKQGADALVASVLKGKGAMPAKGGNATLSEADIKAAVDYMLAQIK